MEKCTRMGCGKSYETSANNDGDCSFHPGAPLFHEGLKSWTCCKEANRPVMTFDEFLAIPGCTSGSHSAEKNEVKMPVVTANVASPSPLSTPATTSNGEATAPVVAALASTHLSPNAAATTAAPPVYRQRPSSPYTAAAGQEASTSKPAALVEEQDPPDAVIPPSSACKRLGCKATYSADSPRADQECTYHPLPAIFHEGSKGYACCKRRVLEFDEFLRIEGCKKGKHLFVGAPKVQGEGEEMVQCRSDMYQTPTQVICSVFGKGADKERSSVRFDEWELHVDLVLPGNKRFARTFELYGPIDPAGSAYKIMGTKLEMTLKKADGRSWPALEAQKDGRASASLITFGVQGRTGSVGAKQMIYNGDVVNA